jgi:serine acetyltransferase
MTADRLRHLAEHIRKAKRLAGIHLRNYLRFRNHRMVLSCDIPLVLPESTQIGHCVGIVINHEAQIGEDVTIQQNVTVGVRGGSHARGVPTVSDGVHLGAGAVVLGDVTIGADARIGANAVVLDDVPPHATAVGAPAQVVRSRGEHAILDEND